jgi:starch-binding outer membrane protein, SusD/RagB family
MKRMHSFTRSAIGASLALALSAGCGGVQDSLLEPQQPGVIKPEDAGSPVGADALRKGALGRMRSATEGGDGLWLYTGLLADEWKTGDTFIQRVETDQRLIQSNNGNVNAVYVAQHRLRGAARDAINALTQYMLPGPVTDTYLAQMWFVMGIAEMNLAEDWCNGVPYSEIVDGVPQYAPASTSAEGLTRAMTHLDSALALATATDTATANLRQAIQLARARVLVNQGQFATAAGLVTGIPTTFRWNQTHSLTTSDVGAWSFNNSQKRWVVSDSFDASGRILNAIPFASAADPRVPVGGTSISSPLGRAFDNSTPFTQQLVWTNRSGKVALWSGIDARLIEAENELQLGNFAAMQTILNTLRGAQQQLSDDLLTPVMAAQATPGTAAAARDRFFREKAFWQFGRGWRLNDLRRLMRQYGLPQDQVYPTGTFFKTSLPYGTDITFPVTSSESPNPNYPAGGCIDRNP